LPELPDKRFRAFDGEIRHSNTRVISLDCFDTLLWRRVPKPTDIHLLVGEQLREAGILASHITPQGYAHLRVLAEQKARALQHVASGSSEVTLEQIHDLLEPAIATKSLQGLAAITELQIERENVFADARLAAYLDALVGELPRHLIIVSDTYFSGEQLHSLLGQTQLQSVQFASVHTSSDAGTGKGAHLWERTLEELGLEADQLVHLGDNPDADVSYARRIGIRAVHYPTMTDRFGPVEIRERIVGGGTYPTRYCDPARGDAGITAIRRRATWTSPGRELELAEQIAWQTGLAVFGPVFTGFSQWVHEQASAEGVRRLLFLMREGKFLKEMADHASIAGTLQPATHAAWVSREACARASIYEGSAAELESFLARLSPPSPPDLAESLGLEPSDIPGFESLCDAFGLGRDRDGVLRSMLDVVLGRPELVEKVVARSAVRRARLKDYLRRLAGPGEGPIGLVDVGWSGRIQESLEAMFDQDDEQIEFRGFYLLANVGASERVLRGSHLQGYLGTVGTNPFDIAGITGGAEIVELVSTSEEGSLLEMGENDQPILASPVGDSRERACRDLVQLGALAYQREWLEYQQPDLPAFETTKTGIDTLTQILKRFVSLPNEDEAAAFSWWLHEENYGSEDAEPLVPPRYLSTLRYRSAEDLHSASASDMHWTGGAAALVDKEMSDAIFAMLEATIDPGRFSSPPEGAFRLNLVASNSAVETISVPLVRNRHGLSLVEWRGDVQGVTRIVLQPAELFTLMRLDLVEIMDEAAGADPVTLLQWSKESGRQALRTSSIQWVASQVMAVDGSSTITIDFPTPVFSPALRVSVAGAFLQVSADPADAPETNDLEKENADLRREIENLYRTKLFRFAAIPRRIYGAIRR
jgi:FMN phosphatase YigB (HAD superfamily)